VLDLFHPDELLPLIDRQYIAVEFAPDAPAIEWKQQSPAVIYQHPQIKRESVTLGDCFELYMSSEQLEAGWFCSKCKMHVAPSKKTEIWRLPSILVLTLKRFSHNATNGRSSKIYTPVDFPLRGLDLSPYLPADQRADTPLYDLFSVMNHHGAMGFGHYTAAVHGHVDGAAASSSSSSAAAVDEAACVADDSWTLCDDESLEAISSSSVVTNDAYVLFYRRRL
jgi:ubiquitin C-terminal hydrolase